MFIAICERNDKLLKVQRIHISTLECIEIFLQNYRIINRFYKYFIIYVFIIQYTQSGNKH